MNVLIPQDYETGSYTGSVSDSMAGIEVNKTWAKKLDFLDEDLKIPTIDDFPELKRLTRRNKNGR